MATLSQQHHTEQAEDGTRGIQHGQGLPLAVAKLNQAVVDVLGICAEEWQAPDRSPQDGKQGIKDGDTQGDHDHQHSSQHVAFL